MRVNLVIRSWQSVKPHIPSIKFRKGVVVGHEGSHMGQVIATAPSQATGKPNFKSVQNAPPIYDWQLPYKYRRQPMSQQEIDFINRGGPE